MILEYHFSNKTKLVFKQRSNESMFDFISRYKNTIKDIYNDDSRKMD